MERERWEKVYRILVRLDNGDFRGVFRAASILGVLFWAVVHDRPACWACRRKNWPLGLWRGRLPSQSTMSRRLKRPEIRALLEAVARDPAVVGQVPPVGPDNEMVRLRGHAEPEAVDVHGSSVGKATVLAHLEVLARLQGELAGAHLEAVPGLPEMEPGIDRPAECEEETEGESGPHGRP